MSRKLLVIDCAALGAALAARRPAPAGLTFRRAQTVFPALTCVAQASFRTAAQPREHGLVANGLFFPELRKVLFWEQAAALVAGPRIWSGLRARGGRVGLMFWQQSLGEEVDLIVSPKPVHKHEGGMIQDCYTQPHDLYERLCIDVGRRFNLMHYWGPLASHRSSAWVTDATLAVMHAPDLAPELLLTYLPHLDYDLQRRGPDHPAADRALEKLYGFLERLVKGAAQTGYDVLLFGDYSIGAIGKPAVFPNRALRDAGLFHVRKLKGMAYPDFFASDAFAVVDHEVAHVHTSGEAATRRAREVLAALPGVGAVLEHAGQREYGVDHPRAGALTLVAAPGAWFAYPWFTEKAEAPDFATHVDIHNKPGYDPCELFFGWPPPAVSMDTAKIKGSHGRTDPGAEIAWASTLKFDFEPRTLLDLARGVRDWCERP
jgi:predicted AlkP superfamily pyrophosphatase or phosphodiesterase